MVAAEEMGHKGVRAMSPVDSALANALRVKLGKGRDLPEAPKPKRVPKPKEEGAAKSRTKKSTTDDDALAEVKPAATIVKPKPAVAEVVPEVPMIPVPEPEIIPEPPVI